MLEAAEYTLPGIKEDGGLVNAFVRYTPVAKKTATPWAHTGPQVALFLLHGVAYHKESWLPTLEHLFEIQNATPTTAFTIVEAWSMDSPNHGRAAVMNDHLLQAFPGGVAGTQWARAVNLFLKSGLIAPGTTVAAIGHSAGACILVQATDGHPLDRPPFSSLIMVEPPMITPEMLKRGREENAPLIRAVDAARARKDIWPSRAAAKEWFAKRYPWRRWDPRALDLYVEYGLRDLPSATYPDKQGVTLATTRVQEVGGYVHYEDSFAAMERLKVICPAMPVHCIFGSVIDINPIEAQMDIANEKVGRKMRSIVRITGAGHLVVQEAPRNLAVAIWGILHEEYHQSALPAATSKL
ncbi:Alpha/beta hydrolase fold-1 [Cubamyces menziesii]|uniref:AB hydrolase-1 domain-containing protein n=1 Tax=Trametes cubensis TaxID=1111947 RepID=A0AAD7TMN1_9APHY|nr:Alpha/beta hydrolase fold-1 [Cubamyces menziesii]KAJ8469469.1 hypothetical protein ONZ51_g8964 [Trametes cubensis]